MVARRRWPCHTSQGETDAQQDTNERQHEEKEKHIVNDPLLGACCTAWQTATNRAKRSPMLRRASSQYCVIGTPLTYSMIKKGEKLGDRLRERWLARNLTQ